MARQERLNEACDEIAPSRRLCFKSDYQSNIHQFSLLTRFTRLLQSLSVSAVLALWYAEIGVCGEDGVRCDLRFAAAQRDRFRAKPTQRPLRFE